MFQLHERLAADSVVLGELPLSLVLLSRCATFPWLILVPRRPNTREWYELSADDRKILGDEIAAVSDLFRRETGCDKINIACLGNQVPQLHVHIIARYREDAAWPQPVWCYPGMEFRDTVFLNTETERFRRLLSPLPDFKPAWEEP